MCSQTKQSYEHVFVRTYLTYYKSNGDVFRFIGDITHLPERFSSTENNKKQASGHYFT
jgi:hypothetical protein